MNDIKDGDIVCLKSNAEHKMTVLSADNNFARVIWYNPITDKLERDKLECIALIKVS